MDLRDVNLVKNKLAMMLKIMTGILPWIVSILIVREILPV